MTTGERTTHFLTADMGLSRIGHGDVVFLNGTGSLTCYKIMPTEKQAGWRYFVCIDDIGRIQRGIAIEENNYHTTWAGLRENGLKSLCLPFFLCV